MNLTLSIFCKRNRHNFFHLKPTSTFLVSYVSFNRTIPTFSFQKLPKIQRKYLIKLL